MHHGMQPVPRYRPELCRPWCCLVETFSQSDVESPDLVGYILNDRTPSPYYRGGMSVGVGVENHKKNV